MSLNQKFDIVIFLGQDWPGYHRQSMIECLARNMIGRGKILCVERPICLLTTPVLHPRKFLDWVTGRRGIRQIDNNLFLVTPIVALHDHVSAYVPIIVEINKKVLSKSIRKAIHQIDFKGERRLVWLLDPIQVDYLGVAEENYTVYECLDANVELATNNVVKRLLATKEDLLVRKADLVFTTGEIEYRTKKAANERTFYTPNGVDTELFQRALDNKTQVPPGLAKIPKPRIGYFGNWAAYCDTELLIEVAREKPEWSFVFVGSITIPSKEKDKLARHPNLYFLGWKEYDSLPAYLKGFDLAMTPFKSNRLTVNADPLKTYEYMAGGCPVIATDIPQARRFPGLVTIVRSKAEFIAAAENLLRNKNRHLRNLLVEEAGRHSWQVRVSQMLGIIDNNLLNGGMLSQAQAKRES